MKKIVSFILALALVVLTVQPAMAMEPLVSDPGSTKKDATTSSGAITSPETTSPGSITDPGKTEETSCVENKITFNQVLSAEDEITYDDDTAFVFLNQDVELSEDIVIEEGSTLNLCLHGHSLKGTGEGVLFTNHGTLNIYDESGEGTLTGDTAGGEEHFGGIVFTDGILNIYGGCFTGSTAVKGGAIYVGGGEFSLTGGSITGNTAEIGGGGIYIESGLVTIGGTASVTGNTVGDDRNNIHLSGDNKLAVADPQADACFGITMDEGKTEITCKAAEAHDSCLFSDSDEFMVKNMLVAASGSVDAQNYAYLKSRITQQPAYSNDFTMEVDSTGYTSVQYQWYMVSGTDSILLEEEDENKIHADDYDAYESYFCVAVLRSGADYIMLSSDVIKLCNTEECAHVTVNGDVFLGNAKMEIGVTKLGTFGTESNAPEGFHPWSGGSCKLGLVSSPWGASRDFFLPGTVDEGFLFYWNGKDQGAAQTTYRGDVESRGNYVSEGTVDISEGNYLGTLTTATVGDLAYTQNISMGLADGYATVTLTLTNNGSETMEDLEYIRAFDPDQIDGYDTDNYYHRDGNGTLWVIASGFNTRLGNPTTFSMFTEKAEYPFMYICEPSDKYTVKGIQQDVGWYDYSDFNKIEESYMDHHLFEDTGMGICFQCGDLKAGESVTIKYIMSLDSDTQNAVSAAMESLGVSLEKEYGYLKGFVKGATYSIETPEDAWTVVIKKNGRYILTNGDGDIVSTGDAAEGIFIIEDWFGKELTVTKTKPISSTLPEPASVDILIGEGHNSRGEQPDAPVVSGDYFSVKLPETEEKYQYRIYDADGKLVCDWTEGKDGSIFLEELATAGCSCGEEGEHTHEYYVTSRLMGSNEENRLSSPESEKTKTDVKIRVYCEEEVIDLSEADVVVYDGGFSVGGVYYSHKGTLPRFIDSKRTGCIRADESLTETVSITVDPLEEYDLEGWRDGTEAVSGNTITLEAGHSYSPDYRLHHWVGSASAVSETEANITVYCDSNVHDETNRPEMTVTLTAPSDIDETASVGFDGKEHPAELTCKETWFGGIRYQRKYGSSWYNIEGAPVNAGEYMAYVFIDDENYACVSYNILPAEVRFTLADDAVVEYTGDYQYPVAEPYGKEGVDFSSVEYYFCFIPQGSSSYTYGAYNVGVYDAYVCLDDENFHFPEEFESENRMKIGTFEITRRHISIQWLETSAEYTGEPISPSFCLANILSDDIPYLFITVPSATDAGRTTLTAELAGDYVDYYSRRYDISNPEVNFTIQKAPVNFTVTDNCVLFDGSPKAATVTADKDVSFTITYKDSKGNGVEQPSAAGAYSIYAQIDSSNYRHNGSADGYAKYIGSLVIYESEPVLYTVNFSAGKGSGTMDALEAALEGTLRTLPEGNAFTGKDGAVFAGWTNGSSIYAAGETFLQTGEDMTFTARWADRVVAITGKVKTDDGNGDGAVVTLMAGSRKVAQTIADEDGNYTFTGIIPGTYNLVIEKNGITSTSVLTVTRDTKAEDVTLPAGRVNTVVEVKAGTPEIVVGGMNSLIKDDHIDAAEGGDNIEFLLTAVETREVRDEHKEELEKLGIVGFSLDINVFKTTIPSEGEKTVENVHNLSDLLEIIIPLPAEIQGKGSYGVSRFHSDSEDEEPVLQTLSERPNKDGEYFSVNGDGTEITIHVKKFSVYTITYKEGRVSASAVKTAENDHGMVEVSADKVARGRIVTVTVTPDRGYALSSLTITDAKGNVIELTKVNENTYTFVMPATRVSVRAEFEESDACAFLDVSEDDMFYNAVLWAYRNGITSGTDAYHFSPMDITTRAQMITFLWNVQGCPEPTITECPFEDVVAGSYYEKAVLWGYEKGITAGTSPVSFSPDKTILRCEAVTFLAHMDGVREDATGYISSYLDVNKEDYYYNAVAWAEKKGLTAGTGEGRFSPKSDCLRYQMVSFLFSYFEDNKDVVLGKTEKLSAKAE